MSSGMVIGPTFAGKTVLLATLQHAARTMEATGAGSRFRVWPQSPAMTELFHLCGETIQRGRMPVLATAEVTQYSFELTITQSRFFGLKEVESRSAFRMWDGPGGSLFPEEHGGGQDTDFAAMEGDPSGGGSSARDQMIGELRRAEGIVLCVDANAPEKAGVFFRHLPHLLNLSGVRTLAASRVVVCLTKVDAHVSHRGTSAERAADELNPISLGRQVLTRAGLRALREYLRPTAEVGFGVTSAYGFIRGEGSANYEPQEDRLMTCEEAGFSPQDIDEAWYPFRVLDPFVYLAVGEPGDLRVIQAKEL
jgi:hypothetical protein